MTKPPSTSTLRKRITRLIQLFLKEVDFDSFQGTTAWRHTPGRIEIVHIKFIRPCDTTIIGCTTASFSLEQGLFFESFPNNQVMKFSQWLPEPYGASMRNFHRRTIAQPALKRRDIWLVEQDGSNLEECVADAIKILQLKAEPWFVRFRNDSEVINTLLNELDQVDEIGLLQSWNGGLNCPHRNHLVAYVALGAGELEIARDAFERLLNQNRPKLMAGYPDRDYKKVVELLEQARPAKSNAGANET